MKPYIENSIISDKEVSIYHGTRIVDSKVSDKCIVGDFSRLTNSVLAGYNRVDRNTLIYHSMLGTGSYVGSNSVIMHTEVGKMSSISWGVTIGPANHDYKRISSHDFLYNNFYGLKPENEPPAYNRFESKTSVGNDVWIGTGSTILNGLKIGNGAIVGANTIVTKDVPPYAIIVGNPGKIVKYRFEKKIIDRLLDLNWWDLPLKTIKENYQTFKDYDIEKSIDILSKLK